MTPNLGGPGGPGGRLFFGRNRPLPGRKKIHLGDYLHPAQIPFPPKRRNYSGAAQAALGEMYLNDRLGDCVIAGIAHLEGVFTGNSGSPVIYSPEEIVGMYSAIGGYVSGDPSTDNGCDEVTALNYWKSKGAPAGTHQITAWASVNGADARHVASAIWLCEGVMFGVELPDAWVSPFPSGTGWVWDVAGPSDPQNGHCFVGVGYEDEGAQVEIGTWGMTGWITHAAIAQYTSPASAGELYVVLSPEIIEKATQKAPDGVDWATLVADFQAL